MNILSSFLAGFLSTSFLFVLSFIIVLGVKYLCLIVKDIAERNAIRLENENKRPPTPRKRKKRKAPSDKRSIEIDASQIDKIYVKKSS